MKSVRCPLTVLGVLAVLVPTARATIFAPMSIEDLAASSPVIAIGTVQGVTGVQSPEGEISTLVDVRVDFELKGNLGAAVITLKEDGGSVGDRREVVFGAPSFGVGEWVLLFLTTRNDGSLRTNHLALGKFRLELDAAGVLQAIRHFGPGTIVILPPGGQLPTGSVPLMLLLDAIAARAPARTLPERSSATR
jgi:hypothetical protein